MKVTGLWSLARAVTEHRRRVYILARVLFITEGIGGPWVNAHHRFVVRIHDLEKYLFLPWLWKYYGGKGDRKQARAVYDRMNKVGDVIRRIAAFGVASGHMRRLDVIERVADVTDRHCSPTTLEEMGVSALRPVTDFVSGEELLWVNALSMNYFRAIGRDPVAMRYIERRSAVSQIGGRHE